MKKPITLLCLLLIAGAPVSAISDETESSGGTVVEAADGALDATGDLVEEVAVDPAPTVHQLIVYSEALNETTILEWVQAPDQALEDALKAVPSITTAAGASFGCTQLFDGGCLGGVASALQLAAFRPAYQLTIECFLGLWVYLMMPIGYETQGNNGDWEFTRVAAVPIGPVGWFDPCYPPEA